MVQLGKRLITFIPALLSSPNAYASLPKIKYVFCSPFLAPIFSFTFQVLLLTSLIITFKLKKWNEKSKKPAYIHARKYKLPTRPYQILWIPDKHTHKKIPLLGSPRQTHTWNTGASSTNDSGRIKLLCPTHLPNWKKRVFAKCCKLITVLTEKGEHEHSLIIKTRHVIRYHIFAYLWKHNIRTHPYFKLITFTTLL